MATLGSLIISLEANTAKFTEAMTKAEYAAKKASDNIVGALKTVGVAMGAMFSLSAMDKTFESITSMESALVKMAGRLNTTVETLSSFSVMARKTGMDTDTFYATLTRMEKGLSAAAQGAETATGKFDENGEEILKTSKTYDELGLKANELIKLPLDQRLIAIATAFKENIDPADGVRIAMELGGKSAAGMVNAFREGPEAMQKWIDRARELGVITDEMAQRGAAAKSAAGDLTIAWSNFARELVDSVAPAVTFIISKLTDLIVAARRTAEARANITAGVHTGEFGEWAEGGVGPTPTAPKVPAPPIPSEVFKSPIKPGDIGKGGGKGGGGAKDMGLDRMQSIIDGLQKDLSRLTEGSLAEIREWAKHTVTEIEKVGKKGAETETALGLVAKVETAKKQKATEDYNLFVAKESGNAYVEIEAQARAWSEKYKGFADAEKNISIIKNRKIWEQQASDYTDATNRTKSYFDILASSAPLIEDQFRWKGRSLDLDVRLSQVELERWLRQKNITGEMADQYKALLALTNQSKRFQFEAEKMEKTGGLFGGVQAWAMRRQQSAVLAQGEAGLGLMGDIEKQTSSVIGKGIVGVLKGQKAELDQIGWGIGESIINRTVEWGTTKLFDLFASVIQPATSALIGAGTTTGIEILTGSENAASTLINAGSSLANMIGGLFGGGGGGGFLGIAEEILGGIFHQGGVITAHRGWPLAPDERLIKAEVGERVLSRSQNRAYEAGMSGGATINAPISITINPRQEMNQSDWDRQARMIKKALTRHLGNEFNG